MSDQPQHIAPQPGFQTSFLSSPADIVIGGGAAGAGKTFALLMEVLRWVFNPLFRAVIFRRTIPQVKNSGGLWDTSKELYLKLRNAAGQSPKPTEAPPKWHFPSGATLLFSHLEHEASKFAWDGSQITLLAFDELIHFTESQFWYLVGRNRSNSGIRPYVRATTNPQTSGWVKRLISWWLYPDDHDDYNLRGMAIPERVGVLRYAARHNERIYWGDTPAAAIAALPDEARSKYKPEFVKSVTFIPGALSDNVELTRNDPGYEGNLLAQDKRQGSRLLRGCWYDAEGENELFRYENLYDMFTNSFVAGGQMYMTADIAMEGSDVFRVGIWSGLRLEKIYSWDKSDGKEILNHMERLAHQYKIPGSNICFDNNGVGNFLKGFFKSSYDFRSQSKPLEEDKTKVDYENLRTQCAFRAANLIAEKQIYIDISNDTERDAIIPEFEEHKKTGQSSNGKLTITPKTEIKAALHRSPDYADIVLMRMVFEIGVRRRSWMLQPPESVTATT